MLELTKNVFQFIPFDVELLAFLFFLYFWRSLTYFEKWVGYIILISFCFDVLAEAALIFVVNKPSNQWVYNYTICILFLVVAWFYYVQINTKKVKIGIQYGAVLFLLCHIGNMAFGQGVEVINLYSILPAQAAIAYLAYRYMRQVVEFSPNKPTNDFTFWYSGATLFNNIGTIPVLATINLLPPSDIETSGWLYNLNSIIGYYINFAIIIFGLLWTRKFQK